MLPHGILAAPRLEKLLLLKLLLLTLSVPSSSRAHILLLTLIEPSPSRHNFHIDSARSMPLRVSRSILHRTPVTRSLPRILCMRLLHRPFRPAASFRASTARYALEHRRVAAKTSL